MDFDDDAYAFVMIAGCVVLFLLVSVLIVGAVAPR